jgi:hypothetical protein
MKQNVNCLGCGEPIHPKRLEILPKTKHCVKCSETGKKRGVTVQLGEEDHTYNDIVIMEEDQFFRYLSQEKMHIINESKAEIQNFDSDITDLRIVNIENLNQDFIE